MGVTEKALKGLGYTMVGDELVRIKPDNPHPVRTGNSIDNKLLKSLGVVEKKQVPNSRKPTLNKSSLGKYFCSKGGTPCKYEVKKFTIDKNRRYYVFDVVPIGAVRMSQADKYRTLNHIDPKYRKRPEVIRYDAFKQTVKWQAQQMRFELGQVADLVFLIPMPNSWSDKMKKMLVGMPCEVKPDIDNLVKSFFDTLRKNDSDIFYCKAEKRWAYIGSILAYQ